MFGKTLCCTALLLAVSLGQAQAKEYHCKIERNGQKTAALPPAVVVWHNEQTGEVKVLDGLIKAMSGGPIAGSVSVDNDRRITFRYDVKKVSGTNQHGGSAFANTLSYQLTIQKANLSAVMSMKPLGYANTFRGKGLCALQ